MHRATNSPESIDFNKFEFFYSFGCLQQEKMSLKLLCRNLEMLIEKANGNCYQFSVTVANNVLICNKVEIVSLRVIDGRRKSNNITKFILLLRIRNHRSDIMPYCGK